MIVIIGATAQNPFIALGRFDPMRFLVHDVLIVIRMRWAVYGLLTVLIAIGITHHRSFNAFIDLREDV
jgi:hypothetical protein